nr:3-ketoacyl-CoA thiolase 2, peroxisomal-like [Tanacetum cinerariifolium]
MAIGHPLGATVARCVVTLLYEMKRHGKDSRFGVVSTLLYNSILEVNFVIENDLQHILKLVEKKGGGLAYIGMTDRSTSNMSYQSWKRELEIRKEKRSCDKTRIEDILLLSQLEEKHSAADLHLYICARETDVELFLDHPTMFKRPSSEIKFILEQTNLDPFYGIVEVLRCLNLHLITGCALFRKKLEEDLVTYFQDFQNTSESSDDSTNVVNAPREPFVFKQDHGVNSSQNPPHIDECCYECGDALDGIFCQQCTCKSCGKDHFEIIINSNDDHSSSDDDFLYNENIEYVKASPHDYELVSLEDYPDCEVFRALSFSFTRASHPQLHFGNPLSISYRLTFYLLAHLINDLRFT